MTVSDEVDARTRAIIRDKYVGRQAHGYFAYIIGSVGVLVSSSAGVGGTEEFWGEQKKPAAEISKEWW